MRRSRRFAFAALAVTACLVGPADLAAASSPPPDTTPPTNPTNLRVVDLGFNDVTLAWDPSTDESGWVSYETVLDARPDDYQSWAVLDGTSRRYTLLHQGLTYTASVTALDGSHNRSGEATVRFTTPVDTEPPSTPANLRFEQRAGFRDGVVTWDASVDNSGSVIYDLYVSTGSRTGPVAHPRGLFVSVSDLLDRNVISRGTPITFFVRARDTASNASPNSAPLTLTF